MKRIRHIPALLAILLMGTLLPGGTRAHDAAEHMHGHAASGCTEPSLACASAATPFFDAKGRLWLAWSAGGAVSVASSTDQGRHFGPPVVVGRHAERLDLGADARPQIVVDAQGRVVVAYAVFKDSQWNAQVLVATSSDGTHFTPPRPLSTDPASQRFPVLALDGDRVFAAWLDKRTVASARQHGRPQAGAAVAVAWSRDGGEHFEGESVALDHSCECCRLAVDVDAEHRPVVMLRRIYGERERDHAVFSFDEHGRPTPEHRVAIDHWAIDGCPHQGPALAVSAAGTWHAAWFTQGEARQGLFYARSDDRGEHFSPPLPVGDADAQAARPSLLVHGRSVWLAWKEFDGQQVRVKWRRSDDDGLTWGPEAVAAGAHGRSDHPLLVRHAGNVYLSWLSSEQGYQLIPLAP
jgi:hypothetical protein